MPMHESFEALVRPRAIAFLACSTALFLLLSVPIEAEIRNQVALGYDSFIDRFTILEADTFESVQDLYFGIGNAFYYRNGASKAGLSNSFRFGNQSIDEYLDAEGSIAPTASTLIDLRSAFTGNISEKAAITSSETITRRQTRCSESGGTPAGIPV